MKKGLKLGAGELNHLLPPEWEDVIIIISPRMAVEDPRVLAGTLCRYVGVEVVSTLQGRPHHFRYRGAKGQVLAIIIGGGEHCKALRGKLMDSQSLVHVHKQW